MRTLGIDPTPKGFNEAEAMKPRMGSSVLHRSSPAMSRFNEAEAMKPRMGWRPRDHCRALRRASMRPRR